MSINTLLDNPVILSELGSALAPLFPDTGITSLTNTDSNVSVSVSGRVGTVNLANSITVSNNLTVNAITNMKGLVQLNGNAGSTGQILTSQGSSPPIWLAPTTSAGLKFIGLFTGHGTNNPDVTQIVCAVANITGLTSGKTYYCVCSGTYNNRGTTAPTAPDTLMSYSALISPSTELQNYDTKIFGVATLNKIPYSCVFSHTAGSTSETFQVVFFISGTTQINTISTDTLDYYNILVLQET